MKYFTQEQHDQFLKSIERDLRNYYSECFCTHYWNTNDIKYLDVYLTRIKDEEDLVKTSIIYAYYSETYRVTNDCKQLKIRDEKHFNTYEESIEYIKKFLKGIEFLLVD